MSFLSDFFNNLFGENTRPTSSNTSSSTSSITETSTNNEPTYESMFNEYVGGLGKYGDTENYRNFLTNGTRDEWNTFTNDDRFKSYYQEEQDDGSYKYFGIDPRTGEKRNFDSFDDYFDYYRNKQWDDDGATSYEEMAALAGSDNSARELYSKMLASMSQIQGEGGSHKDLGLPVKQDGSNYDLGSGELAKAIEQELLAAYASKRPEQFRNTISYEMLNPMLEKNYGISAAETSYDSPVDLAKLDYVPNNEYANWDISQLKDNGLYDTDYLKYLLSEAYGTNDYNGGGKTYRTGFRQKGGK